MKLEVLKDISVMITVSLNMLQEAVLQVAMIMNSLYQIQTGKMEATG